MKAKFNGKCRDCGGRIEAGDEIRWSRAQGARHADEQTCRDEADYRAESLAEQRMERWAEARFTGTTGVFFENEDYLRAHGMGGY